MDRLYGVCILALPSLAIRSSICVLARCIQFHDPSGRRVFCNHCNACLQSWDSMEFIDHATNRCRLWETDIIHMPYLYPLFTPYICQYPIFRLRLLRPVCPPLESRWTKTICI